MGVLDNLFVKMEEEGINAKMLSDATGISTGNISDWKKGRCLPSALKLIAIADYLNCSVDYLLGRSLPFQREYRFVTPSDDERAKPNPDGIMYNLIQLLCEKKGLTVTKLCVLVTGSSGNLNTWKKGYMRSDYLSKCADILECSTDYLLGRTSIKEINKPVSDSGGFVPLHDDVIRPMVGIAAAGKPLSMTVGCYDMIRISAVSDKHKKISPQDFVVEIHGDSMIDAGIFDGDYAVIHPCPAADNGQIALVAVGEDCTLKRFYRTTGGVELHPCNPDYNVQRYRLSDEIRIMGLFVCTCTGNIIDE